MTGTAVATTPRGARHKAKDEPQTVLQVYARWLGLTRQGGVWLWGHTHWKLQVAVVALAVVIFLWLGSLPAMLLVLLVVLLTAGVAIWHQAHRRDRAARGGVARPGALGRVYPHKLLCKALIRPLLLALLALSGVMPAWGQVWPVSLATTALLLWIVWRELPEGTEPEDEWHTHDNLVEDLFHPSVLGPWREETLPNLRYLGPPRTDEFGTAVMVALPGISWEALASKHSPLAARLGVNRRLLTVTAGGREQGENVVRLWVGTPRKASTTPSPVATASRTNWRTPVRIGQDMRGRSVRFLTVDVHSVLVAKTRAGKTWLARIVVLHALRDPSVDLYVLNGKDKRDDWRPMAPACVRYVGVDDEDSLAAAFDVLDELHELCRGRKDSHSRDLTPVVVLFEEWFSIRQLASAIGTNTVGKDKDDPDGGRDLTIKALDASASRLGSVASGYGVHIIGLAQRGTADYVAMGLKANMSQRVVGMVGDTREVAWTIGSVPGELPSIVGEFLVQTDEDQAVLTAVDVLDDQAWARGCTEAIALRRAEGRLPEQRTCANALAEAVVEVPQVPQVTLQGCVLALLDEHRHLSSTELLGLLPAAVAPSTSEVLGRRLGELPDLVERGYVGSKRGWRLTAGGAAAVLADQQRIGRSARLQGLSTPSAVVLQVQP